jgi:hypothetical protein
MPTIRTYTELCKLHDFMERFRYLRLRSMIGDVTFGYDRWLNQRFYLSPEWKRVRNEVIVRDRGCDLAHDDYPVLDKIAVHHINPMTADEIAHGERRILDPEYLITVSQRTHNAIHFGDERLLLIPLVERRPGDTKLW